MFIAEVKLPNEIQVRRELGVIAGEVIQLCDDWESFEEIFLNNKTELLKETAPLFFNQVLRLYCNRFVLGICKLTDPKSSGKGRDNLVLEILFPDKIPPELTKLKSLAEKIKPLRNKVAAHLSLENIDQQFALPKFHFSEIRQCILLSRKVVEIAWKESTGSLLPGAGQSTGVEIQNTLLKSLAYDKLEQSKLVPNGFWNFPKNKQLGFLKKQKCS